jgi:hypothetical protein
VTIARQNRRAPSDQAATTKGHRSAEPERREETAEHRHLKNQRQGEDRKSQDILHAQGAELGQQRSNVNRTEVDDDKHDLEIGKIHDGLDRGLLEQITLALMETDHLSNKEIRRKGTPQTRGEYDVIRLDLGVLRDHLHGEVARNRPAQDRIGLCALEPHGDDGVRVRD